MQIRPRSFRSVHLSGALILALALLPARGGASIDSFFDTDFDGTWVGTLDLGTDTIPVQASLNVENGIGVAMLRMPESDGDRLLLFSAGFRKIKARRLILEYTETPPSGDDDPVQVTAILRYKAAQDQLRGKVKGGLRGRLTLERADPELTLGRLWTGTVKLGGKSLQLLAQLSEARPAAAARLAAGAVTGWAMIGDDQGPVSGTRNGKSVALMVDLPGDDDLTADLRLARGDNQLKGTLAQNGSQSRAKLLPVGSNNGKPMKLRKVTPGEVTAGSTVAVTVRGKNFGPGVVVHADDPRVLVGTPTLASPRSFDVEVTVPGAVAEGTEIGLRVVNGDGQTDTAAAALTVIAGGGGGGGDTVSFADRVQPIFTSNCALAGCHSAGSAQQGLVLEAGSAFGNIVNAPSTEQPSLVRIAPGDPDNSYLVRKIRGDAGISGSRMPLNRTPLSDGQIQTIVDWVLQGAQNNLPSR